MHNSKVIQSGIAIVEFTLVLPFLLLMISVVVEVGAIFLTSTTLAKSAEDAARYLTERVLTPLGDVRIVDKEADAKNLVVYGNIAGSGSLLVTDLSNSEVTVGCASDITKLICGKVTLDDGVTQVSDSITVQVEHVHTLLFGNLLNYLSGGAFTGPTINIQVSTTKMPFSANNEDSV